MCARRNSGGIENSHTQTKKTNAIITFPRSFPSIDPNLLPSYSRVVVVVELVAVDVARETAGLFVAYGYGRPTKVVQGAMMKPSA